MIVTVSPGKKRFFWFDFETFLIVPGCQAPPIVLMAYAWDDGWRQGTLVHGADPLLDYLLESALLDDSVVMVAHHAVYEILCMLARRPRWAALIARKVEMGLLRCTELREKLLRVGLGDRREGYALDDCMEKHKLPIVLDKSCEWRTRFGELYHLPVDRMPERARRYALEDLSIAPLYEKQEAYGERYFVNQHHQLAGMIPMACATAWGFMTDGKTAAVLVQETRERLEEYRQDLLHPRERLGVDYPALLRYDVEKGVPKPVRNTILARKRCEEVYVAMGREPPRGELTPVMYLDAYEKSGVSDRAPKWTKEERDKIKRIEKRMIAEAIEDGVDPLLLQGNISVDKDACFLSRDPLLQAYSAYGQADGLLTKAERPLLAALAGFPVQGSYNGLVATGRSSAYKGDDPEPGEMFSAYGVQMQNMPRAGEIVEVAEV